MSSFPQGDEKWPVSSAGGRTSVWSPKGDELFFVHSTEDQTLLSAKVELQPSFRVVGIEKLFEGDPLGLDLYLGDYDVMPDGERFVMVQRGAGGPRSVVVVDNWFAEFRDGQ